MAALYAVAAHLFPPPSAAGVYPVLLLRRTLPEGGAVPLSLPVPIPTDQRLVL